jgi:hypothetical protein
VGGFLGAVTGKKEKGKRHFYQAEEYASTGFELETSGYATL